jgi:hypothetical protein
MFIGEGLNMSTRKLLICYESYDNKEHEIEFDNPPVLYDSPHYITFAKGILLERDIPYIKLIEVSTVNSHWSAYEDGLEALTKV